MYLRVDSHVAYNHRCLKKNNRFVPNLRAADANKNNF